jgi:hypothetical protein
MDLTYQSTKSIKGRTEECCHPRIASGRFMREEKSVREEGPSRVALKYVVSEYTVRSDENDCITVEVRATKGEYQESSDGKVPDD